MKLSLVVALSLAAVTGALAAQSQELDFLLHVDANGPRSNCGSAVWSSPNAYCYGFSSGSGKSFGMAAKSVDVQWCSPEKDCFIGANYSMKDGYSRWMKVCQLSANACKNWILGAVKMPNGPFSVVAGQLDGKAILPDGGRGNISRLGGPLNLIVHSTGSVANGNGYTFGFVGMLRTAP